VSTDDSALQEALDDYNNRLADTHDRKRRLSGWGLCAGAATSWAVSALAAGSVLKDPAVAADLDSGTHVRDVAGAGWTSAVCALLGMMLLLGGVPVLWLAGFAFLLSV
jgi:hypothetical protein